MRAFVGHWQNLSRATADSIKLRLNPGEDLEYQMVLPADEQNETIRSGLRCLVKFLMFFFDFFAQRVALQVEMASNSETSLPRRAIYRLS